MQPGATVTGRRLGPALRGHAARSLTRTVVTTSALVGGYFVLPLEHLDGGSVLRLGAGVTALVALFVWQVREIMRSPHPRARAVEALAISLAAFFVGFAAVYYALADDDAGAFTEPLTRLDAGYFTVTVFATVGFGDIAPVTETARTLVTVQMLGDLVMVGVVARMVVRAVQIATHRQGEQP